MSDPFRSVHVTKSNIYMAVCLIYIHILVFRKVLGYRGEKPHLTRGGRVWICCEGCLKSANTNITFAASSALTNIQETFRHSGSNEMEIVAQCQGSLLLMYCQPVSLFSRKKQRISPIDVPRYGWRYTVLLDDQFFLAAPSVTWLTCWVLLGLCAFLALFKASRTQPIAQMQLMR